MTAQEMESRLKISYPGCDVIVLDVTGNEDHFEVRIMAEEFSSMTRVQRHQAVMEVFSEELKSGEVHALAVKPLTK